VIASSSSWCGLRKEGYHLRVNPGDVLELGGLSTASTLKSVEVTVKSSSVCCLPSTSSVRTES